MSAGIAVIAGAGVGVLGACRGILGIEDRPVAAQDDGGALQDGEANDAGGDDAEVDAGPRWCETLVPRLDFCADFDRGDLAEGFVNAGQKPDPGVAGGGTIEPDTTYASSRPRSARLTLPPLVTDTTYASAFLITQLPKVPISVIVAIDVRIDTESIPAGKGRVTLLNVNFGRGVGAVGVFRDATGTVLEVYDDPSRSVKRLPFAETLPVGQWRTLSLDIHNYADDGGPDGRVTAVLGGVAAVLPIPAAYQTSTIRPYLEVGAFTARGPMEAFRVNVDNVRVRIAETP